MAFRHLLGVAGLYLAIQACWFIAIPPFEGPDEIQHYDYARYVALNGHLPDRPPTMINDGGFFTGEWTQEVAYYWLFGQILRPTGFQDLRPGDGLHENPHSMWYGGTSPDVFVQSTPLRPHVHNGMLLGRALSVLFGLGTLLCVFGAIRACTRDDRIAAIAAGCVALVPQFGAQHILITNDTPAALWASVASALVVSLLMRQGRPVPLWLGAAIGAASGLAIATKLTAGVVVIAMPLALWYRRRTMPWLPQAIAWTAGMLATAGVAFGRNWIVFGDPLATALKHAVVSQFGFVVVFKPRELASYADLARLLFRGMWASIGWVGWTPNVLWLKVLFAALSVFLFVCLGIATWMVARASVRRVAAADEKTPAVVDAVAVMWALFALHTAAFIVSISFFAGYSARYFLPMIVPFIVLAIAGAQRLFVALRGRFGAEIAGWTLLGVMMMLTIVWLGTFNAVIAAFHFEGVLK
jgi:4-amino-4-deoxy-L-arabinose transferase-like glycosyltransferase